VTGIRSYRLLLEVLRLDCHAPTTRSTKPRASWTLHHSDGMREERMQDLRNSIVGAILCAAEWPGPFRGLKKR
jgi:hypothetical protein